MFERQCIDCGPPSERVLLVTGDLDGDGEDEIVVAGRKGPEGLRWYDRQRDGTWVAHLIDDTYPSLEAGGCLHDLTGNGRLDFIGGSDFSGRDLMWWQQPDDPTRSWPRHRIWTMPATQSHDQFVCDLDGDGRPELYFWCQNARTLFRAPVPDDPTASPWPEVQPVKTGLHEEGFALADVDGDGRDELISGSHWYQAMPDGSIASHRFAPGYTRTRPAAADFDGDGRIEIAVCESDVPSGRLAVFKPAVDPTRPWIETRLHDDLLDPHSLFVADFFDDGRPGFFAGELGDPHRGLPRRPPTHRFYRWLDGRWSDLVVDQGVGSHEAKSLRLDTGLAIAGKPYLNLRAPTRNHEADCIHVWTATGLARDEP